MSSQVAVATVQTQREFLGSRMQATSTLDVFPLLYEGACEVVLSTTLHPADMAERWGVT